MCSYDEYTCLVDGDEECLSVNWLCDGDVDCDDRSDEDPEVCAQKLSKEIANTFEVQLYS